MQRVTRLHALTSTCCCRNITLYSDTQDTYVPYPYYEDRSRCASKSLQEKSNLPERKSQKLTIGFGMKYKQFIYVDK